MEPTEIIIADERAVATVTTKDVLDQFAGFLRLNVAQGDASRHTLRAYLSNLAQYVAWCNASGIDPGLADEQVCVAFRYHLAQSGYKRSTIGVKLSAVRRFYEAAIWRGLRKDNPAAGLKPPREHTSRRDRILERYLTKQEIHALLTTPPWTPMGIRDRAILAMMYYHGLRVSEVAAVCINDIVKDQIHVRAGKGRKDRALILIEQTKEIIYRWLIERAKVVTDGVDEMFVSFSRNGTGTALSVDGIRIIVNTYMVQAGCKRPGVSCHALRHAHASHAVAAGVDLIALSREMGHASPETTGVYTHIVDAVKQNPAAFLVGDEEA